MGRSKAWRRYVANPDPKSQALIDKLRVTWKQIKLRPPAERTRWLRSSEGIVALGAQTCNQLLKEIERQHKRIAKAVAAPAWLDALDHEGIVAPIPTPNPIKLMRCPVDGERKMSLRTLAERVGVSVETMREWEATRSRPGAFEICLIVGVLNPAMKGEAFASYQQRCGKLADNLRKQLLSLPLERRGSGRLRLSRCEVVSGGPDASNAADHAQVSRRRWTSPLVVDAEDRLDTLNSVEALYYSYAPSPSARAIQLIEIRGSKQEKVRLHTVGRRYRGVGVV